MRASGLPWAARAGIRMHTGAFSAWSHPDVHPARMRIGFVILSNRLGRDLTPFYQFMTAGQSQYSSYSNELGITEPFNESSEEST